MTPAQRRILAPLAQLGVVDLAEEVDRHLAPMLEDQWQEQFLGLAHALGWEHNFTRRTIGRGKQWTTATSQKGWPDLTLWSQQQRRIMFVELKREEGTTTPEQVEVLVSLHLAGQEVHLWRPRHLDAAQVALTPTRRTR